MRLPRWAPLSATLAASLALAAAVPASAGLASARVAPAAQEPLVKLIAAQRHITVPRFGKQVFLDPGVYVAAFGSPLEFRVQRASYARPLTITQVIKVPGEETVLRRLPAWALRGWSGLRRFMRITVRNLSGKIVGSSVLPFCPGSYNAQRVTPGSPYNSPFPTTCYANPFTLGMVWGLQRGWAVDPAGNGFIVGPGGQPSNVFKLALGKYVITVSITRMWRALLHVTPAGATAQVKLTVVKGSICGDICPPSPAARHAGALPRLPAVPAMAHPPASVLPDLIPLPSSGISVQNVPATAKHPAQSYLSFGATVWIGGNARLDVEGFRSGVSPVMAAYQYFWHDGRIVGRARAGTMGFDSQHGHDHWHFQQFAQYRLLNGSKSVVVRSRKVGFCIAPTDAIDLLIPHALWQPTYTGFAGACGVPTALWVQEMLPIGWGDTYYQGIAGQAFDISNLPNGTYYIAIIANPERVLFESNYANDVSLRKVILGGTPGHRTVRVPAFHGIDPER